MTGVFLGEIRMLLESRRATTLALQDSSRIISRTKFRTYAHPFDAEQLNYGAYDFVGPGEGDLPPAGGN